MSTVVKWSNDDCLRTEENRNDRALVPTIAKVIYRGSYPVRRRRLFVVSNLIFPAKAEVRTRLISRPTFHRDRRHRLFAVLDLILLPRAEMPARMVC